jgi:D-alanine-D-alanine ligase
MKIGLTYDLRDEYLAAGYSEEQTAEFDRPETIDALEDALRALGHVTDRIGNVRQLACRLASGERWGLVFNICEGLHGPAREAQVPSLLEVYHLPYTFSDPVVMSVCLHKGLAKTIIQAAGLPTPAFTVVDDRRDLEAVAAKCLAAGCRFPLFVKPVAEGTGKGITPASRVTDHEALVASCRQLLFEFRQPVLIEQFLPGRELTVGILGSGRDAQVLGTLEVLLRPDADPGVYSYRNKEQCEDLVEYRVVDGREDCEVARAEQIALAAWHTLGCRDAGRVDLRSDSASQPHFLEANPLAGLHPSHSDLPILASELGVSYVELIRRILASAMVRCAILSLSPQDSPPLQASSFGASGC